jgi:hypothetical protein
LSTSQAGFDDVCETERLFRGADPAVIPFLTLSFFCGVQVATLERLSWSDVKIVLSSLSVARAYPDGFGETIGTCHSFVPILTVSKERVAEIAADFMTTFYGVQVGALETQELHTTPVPFWLISFSDTIKEPLRDMFFVVVLPDCKVVEPSVSKRM